VHILESVGGNKLSSQSMERCYAIACCMALLSSSTASVCTLAKGQSNFPRKELVAPTAPMKFDHLVGLQSIVLSNILLMKHSKSTADDITADCKSPSFLN